MKPNSHRLDSIVALLIIVLSAAACQAPPPQVAVTLARQAVVATQIVIVVTNTPQPTRTPTPMPTLAYDISQYQGRWQLDLNYHIVDFPVFTDIRYSGTFELNVAPDGSIISSGPIYTTLVQPPCNANVKEGNSLDLTVQGQLTRVVEGGDVVALLTLAPREPLAVQSFLLACADPNRSLQAQFSILWPALAATNQLELSLPFVVGATVTDLRNLTGTTGGKLFGTLTTEVRLNR